MTPESQELIDQLAAPHSRSRRSAAKRLRKLRDPATGPALSRALEIECKDRRTWETQYHLIMAVAETGHADSLPLLRTLASAPLEYMTHLACGDALVRLQLDNLDDACSEALRGNNRAVVDGTLRALAMLQLVPEAHTIERLLAFASAPENQPPRFWAAAAAPGWRSPGVKPFLEACLSDPLEDTRRAAAAALEGRYLKWKPP